MPKALFLRHCNFRRGQIPFIFTSVRGKGDHYLIRGTDSIYNVSYKSFTVLVSRLTSYRKMFYKRNLTVEDMTKDRVEINFLAVVVDEQGANPPYQVT